jgi:hypothetical protein
MDQTRYQNTDQNKIFSGAAVDYLTAGQKANIRPYNLVKAMSCDQKLPP